MKVVVLDTSAIIRLYIPDGPLPGNLEDDLASAWKGETILMSPDLALAETTQVLWKKEQSGYITQSEADIIMEAILELPIEIVGHRDIINPAFQIARQYKLSVYDSLFFALADSQKAILVTADQELNKTYQHHCTNNKNN